MIQKDALDRYIEARGLSNKYRQSPVDAYNKAHGKDPITKSVVKALQEVKIEVTPEKNDEIGAAIADEVGKQLQKDMQSIINSIQKQK